MKEEYEHEEEMSKSLIDDYMDNAEDFENEEELEEATNQVKQENNEVFESPQPFIYGVVVVVILVKKEKNFIRKDGDHT